MSRTASDVRIGDKHVVDALSDLRHSSRLLTLAIVGLIHCPHDVSGEYGPDPFNIDPNHNWGHDLEQQEERFEGMLDLIDFTLTRRTGPQDWGRAAA